VAQATQEAKEYLQKEIQLQEERLLASKTVRRDAETKWSGLHSLNATSSGFHDHTVALIGVDQIAAQKALWQAFSQALEREKMVARQLKRLQSDLKSRKARPYMTTRDVHKYVIKAETDSLQCRYVELVDWAEGDGQDRLSDDIERAISERYSIHKTISKRAGAAALIGSADYFVSHSWDSPWADLVAAVESHASMLDLEVAPYYWVDIFAVCQHWATDESSAGRPGYMPRPCEERECVGSTFSITVWWLYGGANGLVMWYWQRVRGLPKAGGRHARLGFPRFGQPKRLRAGDSARQKNADGDGAVERGELPPLASCPHLWDICQYICMVSLQLTCN
jgi:hypothetical protein